MQPLSVEEIINGLRENQWAATYLGKPILVVEIPDAVAAVHAAADTRTQEIVALLRHEAATVGEIEAWEAVRDAADEVARRFPNGGTPDPQENA